MVISFRPKNIIRNRKGELSAFTLKLSDFFTINASFFIAIVLVFIFRKHWPIISIPLDLITYNALWLFFSSLFKLYQTFNLKGTVTTIRASYKTLVCMYLLFSFFISFISHPATNHHLYFLIFDGLILLVLMTLSRIYLTYLIEFVAAKAKLNRTCTILGDNNIGKTLVDFFSDNHHLYTFTGFSDSNYKNIYNLNGSLSEKGAIAFINDLVEENVEDIYVTLSITPDLSHLYTLAENACIKMHFVSSVNSINRNNHFVEEENIPTRGLKISNLKSEPLSFLRNRIKKRAFDLGFSSFVIIFLLSWLYPLVALIIKIESKGPALFKQERSGKDNKSFYCYKFRSMKVNTDSDTKQATKNDSRLTKFGAFMRKTSIDELPQFFNVWKGEMSIVGPRPHMLKHTQMYQQLIEQYLVRQFLKPGITGWAQVNGYRGETKELSMMEKRIEHDIWYMENWSLMLDVRIVFMTVINVIKGEPEAY